MDADDWMFGLGTATVQFTSAAAAEAAPPMAALAPGDARCGASPSPHAPNQATAPVPDQASAPTPNQAPARPRCTFANVLPGGGGADSETDGSDNSSADRAAPETGTAAAHIGTGAAVLGSAARLTILEYFAAAEGFDREPPGGSPSIAQTLSDADLTSSRGHSTHGSPHPQPEASSRAARPSSGSPARQSLLLGPSPRAALASPTDPQLQAECTMQSSAAWPAGDIAEGGENAAGREVAAGAGAAPVIFLNALPAVAGSSDDESAHSADSGAAPCSERRVEASEALPVGVGGRTSAREMPEQAHKGEAVSGGGLSRREQFRRAVAAAEAEAERQVRLQSKPLTEGGPCAHASIDVPAPEQQPESELSQRCRGAEHEKVMEKGLHAHASVMEPAPEQQQPTADGHRQCTSPEHRRAAQLLSPAGQIAASGGAAGSLDSLDDIDDSDCSAARGLSGVASPRTHQAPSSPADLDAQGSPPRYELLSGQQGEAISLDPALESAERGHLQGAVDHTNSDYLAETTANAAAGGGLEEMEEGEQGKPGNAPFSQDPEALQAGAVAGPDAATRDLEAVPLVDTHAVDDYISGPVPDQAARDAPDQATADVPNQAREDAPMLMDGAEVLSITNVPAEELAGSSSGNPPSEMPAQQEPLLVPSHPHFAEVSNPAAEAIANTGTPSRQCSGIAGATRGERHALHDTGASETAAGVREEVEAGVVTPQRQSTQELIAHFSAGASALARPHPSSPLKFLQSVRGEHPQTSLKPPFKCCP